MRVGGGRFRRGRDGVAFRSDRLDSRCAAIVACARGGSAFTFRRTARSSGEASAQQAESASIERTGGMASFPAASSVPASVPRPRANLATVLTGGSRSPRSISLTYLPVYPTRAARSVCVQPRLSRAARTRAPSTDLRLPIAWATSRSRREIPAGRPLTMEALRRKARPVASGYRLESRAQMHDGIVRAGLTGNGAAAAMASHRAARTRKPEDGPCGPAAAAPARQASR